MNPFSYRVYSTKNPFNVTDNIETPEHVCPDIPEDSSTDSQVEKENE